MRGKRTMNRIKKLYQAVAICMVMCGQTVLTFVETSGQHVASAGEPGAKPLLSRQQQIDLKKLTTPTQAIHDKTPLFPQEKQTLAKHDYRAANNVDLGLDLLFNHPDEMQSQKQEISLSQEQKTVRKQDEQSVAERDIIVSEASTKTPSRNINEETASSKPAEHLPADASTRTNIITYLYQKLPTKAQLKSSIPNLIRTIKNVLSIKLSKKQEADITADLEQDIDQMPARPKLFHVQQFVQRAIDRIRNLTLPTTQQTTTTLNPDGSYSKEICNKKTGYKITIQYDAQGKEIQRIDTTPIKLADNFTQFQVTPADAPAMQGMDAQLQDIVAHNKQASHNEPSINLAEEPMPQVLSAKDIENGIMHYHQPSIPNDGLVTINPEADNPEADIASVNSQSQQAGRKINNWLRKRKQQINNRDIPNLPENTYLNQQAKIFDDIHSVEQNSDSLPPLDLALGKQPTLPTMQTSTSRARMMRLNDNGEFTDGYGNALHQEEYTFDKKGNAVTVSSRDQQQAAQKINNWMTKQATNKKNRSGNSNDFKTFHNKNGTSTTVWAPDKQGMQKTVAYNKQGQASEIITNQSTSQQTITNYHTYDLLKPDQNNRPSNIASSMTHDNDFIQYTLYKPDGSSETYTIYSETYFDENAYTMYNKGDIEYQSSNPNIQPEHLKKDSSAAYKELKNKAGHVANIVMSQIIQD